jgi:hypothetical protein
MWSLVFRSGVKTLQRSVKGLFRDGDKRAKVEFTVALIWYGKLLGGRAAGVEKRRELDCCCAGRLRPI